MKRRILLNFMLCLILIGLLISMMGGATLAQSKSPSKIRVIVGFKDKPHLDVIWAQGGDIKYVYNIIPAIACSLPETAVEALRRKISVMYIEPDGVVQAVGQVLPWGVDRIDAEKVHSYNKGAGVKIAVVDSGMDYRHPDLDANYKGGYDFVNNDADPMDDNGHGTHVAGIIAAEDNALGVVGVAPEAWLYSLKVLDSTGYGFISDAIAAIDWAVSNGMHIVSMSLGSDTDSYSLRMACDSAYEAGLLLVAAAGNNATTISYPARYDSVIAVGATKSDNTRAEFSGTGQELELVAPGVYIYSTYLNGYYIMSGTSMACPHVTGTAALVFNTAVNPSYDLDGDGVWDASEVRRRLQDTAYDLGSLGRDPLYGYGLVNAFKAADDVPPSRITDLIASAEYPNIYLKWTAATDNVGVDHYNIYRSTTEAINKAEDLLATASKTATSYVDSTGIAGTTYYYAVCAVDAAGNEAELSNIVSIVAPSNLMHVGSIILSKQTLGRGYFTCTRAVAVVTILDGNGNPVKGARVYGRWSGLVGGGIFGITDANGRVTFKSRFIRNASGTFTFTVNNVTKNGWIYDSEANEETSDSITV